jgi:hypothetical protein
VGPANRGDGDVLPALLAEFPPPAPDEHQGGDHPVEPPAEEDQSGPVVYGDAAYGGGESLAYLERIGGTAMTKVQAPHAPGGRFPKDRFGIDLHARTVTCPAGVTVPIRPLRTGGGYARFGTACRACPLRSQCTDSRNGRAIMTGPHEALLAEGREHQKDSGWQADYRAHRPKVERKLAHMLFRRHGGRRARVRGKVRVAQDWKLLAAAVNLARFAVLGVQKGGGGWALAT